MYYAFDPSSAYKRPIEVADWNLKNPNRDAECIFCGNPLSVRGDISNVTMHFMHHAGSNCPTIALAAEPYKDLTRFPRDPVVETSARKHARDNFFLIVERIRKINKRIIWSDIATMTANADARDIWSLKQMPHSAIPYALMTCIDKVPHPSKAGTDVYYVIQPAPSTGTFWNFPTQKKRFILEVEVATKIFRPYEMDETAMNSHFIHQALANI